MEKYVARSKHCTVYIEIQKICMNCICRSKTFQLGSAFGLSQTYLNNEATIVIGLTPYIIFWCCLYLSGPLDFCSLRRSTTWWHPALRTSWLGCTQGSYYDWLKEQSDTEQSRKN